MSVKLFVIIFAALLLFWCQASQAAKAGRRGRTKTRIIIGIYDFKRCKDKRHSMIVSNTTNRIGKDGSEFLDVDFELTTSTKTLRMMTLIMHRCPLEGGACEYFDTWSFKWPCGIIAAKGMIWTPVIESTNPRFACPVKKGLYTARNMTADIAALGPVLDTVDATKYSWPYEALYYSEDRSLFMCFTLVGYHKRVKVQ